MNLFLSESLLQHTDYNRTNHFTLLSLKYESIRPVQNKICMRTISSIDEILLFSHSRLPFSTQSSLVIYVLGCGS